MHPDHVAGWNGTLEELAVAVGNMTYEKAAEFIGLLSINIREQATADIKRGRPKLATSLIKTSEKLAVAEDYLHDAWVICEPFMRETDV